MHLFVVDKLLYVICRAWQRVIDKGREVGSYLYLHLYYKSVVSHTILKRSKSSFWEIVSEVDTFKKRQAPLNMCICRALESYCLFNCLCLLVCLVAYMHYPMNVCIGIEVYPRQIPVGTFYVHWQIVF